jgi:hypothetical protein
MPKRRGRPSKQHRNISGLLKRPRREDLSPHNRPEENINAETAEETEYESNAASNLLTQLNSPHRSRAPSPEVNPEADKSGEGFGEGWDTGLYDDSLRMILNSDIDGGEEDSDVDEDIDWSEFGRRDLHQAMSKMAAQGKVHNEDDQDWLPPHERRKFTRKDVAKKRKY